MALNLYRRHRKECEAHRTPESRSGEFEERKKGWKRCGCIIFASGTLKGKFSRRSTGLVDWGAAHVLVATWASWDDELAPSLTEQPRVAEPSSQITIDQAIKDFLKEHEGESADSTVRMYRYLLKGFGDYSAGKGFVVLEQWSTADVREYRKSWAVSPKTATKNMANLKSFFEYCLSNEWIDRNPARQVRKKHNRNEEEEKERVPFSDEELTRMYKACESSYGKGEFDYRYRWTGQDLADFISISVYTGLRISDVATFHADRLLETGECHVRTLKRGKKVCAWIPEWLQQRIRERAVQFGPRIFGAKENSDIEVLTDLWRRKLKRLWKLCGPWEEPPTHHRFRHTFARILLQDQEVTMRHVAELLGNTEEVVRKHYAAWVPERQAHLTGIVKRAFADKPKPNIIQLASQSRLASVEQPIVDSNRD